VKRFGVEWPVALVEFRVVSSLKVLFRPRDSDRVRDSSDPGTINALFYDEIFGVKEPESETTGVTSGGFRMGAG